jgi:hypothetical protein
MDRLERCLSAASYDVSTLVRSVSVHALSGLAQSRRQLLALHKALQDLDRSVFASLPAGESSRRVLDLSQSLESLALQIERTTGWIEGVVPAERTRVLTVIDGLLRECRYQARVLLNAGSQDNAPRTVVPAAATLSARVAPLGVHSPQDL